MKTVTFDVDDKRVVILSLEDAQALQDMFECNPLPHYFTPEMRQAFEHLYDAIEEAEKENELDKVNR